MHARNCNTCINCSVCLSLSACILALTVTIPYTVSEACINYRTVSIQSSESESSCPTSHRTYRRMFGRSGNWNTTSSSNEDNSVQPATQHVAALEAFQEVVRSQVTASANIGKRGNLTLCWNDQQTHPAPDDLLTDVCQTSLPEPYP